MVVSRVARPTECLACFPLDALLQPPLRIVSHALSPYGYLSAIVWRWLRTDKLLRIRPQGSRAHDTKILTVLERSRGTPSASGVSPTPPGSSLTAFTSLLMVLYLNRHGLLQRSRKSHLSRVVLGAGFGDIPMTLCPEEYRFANIGARLQWLGDAEFPAVKVKKKKKKISALALRPSPIPFWTNCVFC